MEGLKEKLTNAMTGTADYLGRPSVIVLAVLLVTIWFLLRPLMEYSVWYDAMDITIFLITFFFLFVIQSSQNADTRAMQDKLDDIIDALPGADKQKEGEEERMKRGTETS